MAEREIAKVKLKKYFVDKKDVPKNLTPLHCLTKEKKTRRETKEVPKSFRDDFCFTNLRKKVTLKEKVLVGR